MKILLCCVMLLCSLVTASQQLPKHFVYLNTDTTNIKVELNYRSSNNFIGRPIDGYKKSVIIVTQPTAEALYKIQNKLQKMGYGLQIFDAYRPQKAVDHFVRWAGHLNDTLKKHQYYPTVPKDSLFALGFIAKKSGHTRGSTVDLTLIELNTGKEVDMGSPYDFFGTISHPFYKDISAQAYRHRMLLRNLMITHGFVPYKNEWWHFTLKNEPFPSTYFDFNIE